MNTTRLGCLSPLALISAFITLIILVMFEIISGNSMFTPGALNAQAGSPLGGVSSHAETGGDCGQCHVAFWSSQTMSDRCLVCHVEVDKQMGDIASLHGILFQGSSPPCQTCHTDHHGPDGSLTAMDTTSFPHDKTGYSLAGHQKNVNNDPFTCTDCHTEGFSTFNQQVCVDCHGIVDATFTNSHLGDFGTDCLTCHDGVDRYGDFDHNQVTFVPTGKHLQVNCTGCHLNARSIPDLQGAPTACEGCHLQDDAHGGRFGTQCGTCHTPDGWEPATFDHSVANFPLEGKHIEVSCENCHTSGFEGTPTTCEGCHLGDDAHAGRFGTLCGTCHTPAGWTPATFDHDLSDFKLTGKHTEVACEGCHTSGFAGTPTDCYSCHQEDDEHSGEFGSSCELCHNPSGWADVSFDHNLTAFPLTGSHLSVRCKDCHLNEVFKGTATYCAGCHTDPAFHAGLFAGMSCDQCHNTSSWIPASFNLSHPGICGEDACINHEGATCRDCHSSGLSTWTCLACHDSNNPSDGGEGGGGSDDD
jgi:hypothetical protein